MADIHIQKLYKSYKNKPVLQGMSLTVNDGELVALVGPSGEGKTTALKILAGLLSPDQGHILVGDRDITGIPTDKRNIVMVFQDNLLFPHLTIGENVTFGLKMLGKSKAYRKARQQELLEIVQLSGLDDRYPRQISGGQQQRVALARALALEPDILLLDEPLSNLDARVREEMRELIKRINKDLGRTIILVTHDQDEAMMMADRIAVLLDGRILQFDTPYEIYRHPLNPQVANLFGPCNILKGYLNNQSLQGNGFTLPIPGTTASGEVEVYLRAEHIELLAGNEKRSGIAGILSQSKFMRGHSYLTVSIGELELLVRTNDYCDLPPHTPVWLRINWDKAHFQPDMPGETCALLQYVS